MNAAFLQLVKVTKSYVDREVVSELSLEIAEGDIVALLGESGCGKSTTLRLIAGLETPDQGEIRIGGRCVSAEGRNLVPPHERGVGLVFQDLALWPHLTVTGNLEFVLASAKVPRRQRAERIAEALRLVQIERYAGTYPGKLSGGEQQRAAIARAIVGRPRLLLFDEPMSNLDFALKSQLLSELAALQKALGTTTVYITHDPAEAVALAHQVVMMKNGRIVETGTVEQLRGQLESEALLRFDRQQQ
jgi:iron(III) transport system ATP-binding protein